MQQVKNDSKHIAALAFPFGTHAAPLLSLVQRLSEAIPDAMFSFFSTTQSNNKIFLKDKVGLGNIKHYNVFDGLPENYVFSGNPEDPVEFFLRATPGNFRQAMEVAVRETGNYITCIISDAFLWFAADLAQELQVPWVPLWTAGPRSLLLHVETDLIRQKVGIDGPEDKTLGFLPGFSPIRAADVPEGIISGDLKSTFHSMLHNMGQMLPRAAAVATNSFEELDQIVVNALKSRLKMFLNVGPFMLTSPEPTISDPQGCLEWLDKQERESVVYISFGSVITPPPHELAALAHTLEESGFPFLWSFRGKAEEKLPQGFLERTREKGKLVPWAPQLRVLNHDAVGLFMTHGGWNSVLEGILGCVPMVVRPFFGDQYLNARTIEAVWGIGVGMEDGKITRDGTMKALSLVLSTEEGKKMKMKLCALKELALDAVQSNGTTTKNFETLVDVITN